MLTRNCRGSGSHQNCGECDEVSEYGTHDDWLGCCRLLDVAPAGRTTVKGVLETGAVIRMLWILKGTSWRNQRVLIHGSCMIWNECLAVVLSTCNFHACVPPQYFSPLDHSLDPSSHTGIWQCVTRLSGAMIGCSIAAYCSAGKLYASFVDVLRLSLFIDASNVVEPQPSPLEWYRSP